MEGRSLQGEREPCGRGVDLRGGAHDPKVRQAPFVREEEVEWWKAGLNGYDVQWGGYEAVGSPSLDFVPEHCELSEHIDCGHENVRAVAEDGKEEGGGQSMTEEGGEADPRGGEAFNSHEGSLCLGQPFDKMGAGCDRGGEPVTQPPDLVLGREDRPVEVDRSIGDSVSVPGRAPVDEFCFWDREAYS